MEAVWRVQAKRADFNALGQQFNIDPVVARVIRNRDMETMEDYDRYLYGGMELAHNPGLMKDMEKACKLMIDKINKGKHIRIISDYDVDGVMSNYILLEGLKKAGAYVSYEIPDRMTDGYGINERIIRDAYKDGVDTLITCDNGIGAFSAVELAHELGMTIIVTDHHEPPVTEDEHGNSIKTFVNADAVVNPKRPDCPYPFKEICGAAVAYKFIRHMYDLIGISWEDEWLVEMLGIATVCDIMPLRDENRVFVKKALELIQDTDNKGLKALLQVHDLTGKKINSYTFGFIIGPCINASGRLDSAKKGLELLLCEDMSRALALAEELKEINVRRKTMTEDGKAEAIALVQEQYMDDTVLVLFMPELHESLAGIVAGRIKEKFNKPTLVFTRTENGILKGSGRSIEAYNMHEKLSEHKELFLKMGGHPMAAGFSIEEDNLDILRTRLNETHGLSDEDLIPVVMIDVAMPFNYITPKLIKELDLLEPFGNGNLKPVFAQANLRVKKVRFMGEQNQYIKIWFMDEGGKTIEAIDFDAKSFIESIKLWFTEEECDKMVEGMSNQVMLDITYYPDINEYNGRTTIQLKPTRYKKA